MAVRSKQASWRNRKCYNEDYGKGWDHYLKAKAEREAKQKEEESKSAEAVK